MKRTCWFALALFPLAMGAQCPVDYTIPQFGVQVDSHVFYGEATLFNGQTDSLFMDIYKPVGDDNESRPIVIWVHGGGFSGGNKASLGPFCAAFAARGYVAATISYRLGFYRPQLLTYPYTFDAAEVIRANYRAGQDGKGAIRFLRGRSGIDSSDVTQVYIGGTSAGGFLAMGVAYVTDSTERPAETFAIGDALGNPRPDLGPVEGTLNLNGHDASVCGVVNVFGAVMDTLWIDGPDDVPVYFYHQTGDPVVPCGVDKPYWGLGLGIPDNYPIVYGSCFLDDYVASLGYPSSHVYSQIHTGSLHTIHDPIGFDTLAANWMNGIICEKLLATELETVGSAEIRVYPTPLTNTLNVQLDEGLWSADLLDLRGRTVLSWRGLSGSEVLRLPTVPGGLYVLTLRSGSRVTSKLVLKQ